MLSVNWDPCLYGLVVYDDGDDDGKKENGSGTSGDYGDDGCGDDDGKRESENGSETSGDGDDSVQDGFYGILHEGSVHTQVRILCGLWRLL